MTKFTFESHPKTMQNPRHSWCWYSDIQFGYGTKTKSPSTVIASGIMTCNSSWMKFAQEFLQLSQLKDLGKRMIDVALLYASYD